MISNSKFKDFKTEVHKCIFDSPRVKGGTPCCVHEGDIKGTNIKTLYRGSGIRGKEDILWFDDNSSLSFEIRIKISGQNINIVKYSIRWENSDEKNIFLIRYEWDEAFPEKYDHPRGHLHINKYNDLRLPTEKLEFRNIFSCIENWIEKRRETDKKPVIPVN